MCDILRLSDFFPCTGWKRDILLTCIFSANVLHFLCRGWMHDVFTSLPLFLTTTFVFFLFCTRFAELDELVEFNEDQSSVTEGD